MTRPAALMARLLSALALVAALTAAPMAQAQDAPAAAPAAPEVTAAEAPATGAAPAEAPVDANATAATIDYSAWERVAQRAEQALEAGRASDQALQTLRIELVQWRDIFSKAKAENQIRITTFKTQISTLGPAPADGATEPAILTERRIELTAQLDALEAPVKAAQLAHARANALIGEIDNMVRARQTDELFSNGPMPINPANWPEALDDLRQTAGLVWSGIASSWGTETQRTEFRSNLPATMLLGVVALVLLLRGRSWVIRAGARVRMASSGPAQGVWGFIVSLGQVAAPLIGVYALVETLHSAGVLGLRAQVLADELPAFGLVLLLGRWLGSRVFGQPGAPWYVLNLPTVQRAEGRFDAAMLGLLYGLSILLHQIAGYEDYPLTTRAVLFFPIFAFGGLFLFRLGRLLRIHAAAEAEAAEDGPGFLTRTVRLTGFLLMAAAIVGPVAAAAGYNALADSFLFPAALTLALVAAILVLHHFFVDLYGLVFKTDDHAANDALLPVLASFTMALVSVPVLALIWGARVTDLTEAWTRVKEGVPVGDTVISPADLLTFVIVFGIGYAATRLLQGMLESTILPKTRIDLGGRNAIKSGVGYIGLILAALAAITSAGLDLSSLAIVAGALSVGIGFGLQNIVSNFVSGIILLIERPISEGDWIEVGGQMGTVRDISVRSTRIETFDRTDVILPNSDLISGVVTNYTRGNLIGRVIVPVGVAYGTDTRKVEAILLEVAHAHPLVTVNPPPAVVFTEFGADSLNFEIRAILKDVNFKLVAHSDMNHEIARRFVEEGIEIPFAQRDIWLRNPEALTGAQAKPAKPKKDKTAPKPPAAPAPAPVPEDEAARKLLEAADMETSHGYGREDQDD